VSRGIWQNGPRNLEKFAAENCYQLLHNYRYCHGYWLTVIVSLHRIYVHVPSDPQSCTDQSINQSINLYSAEAQCL